MFPRCWGLNPGLVPEGQALPEALSPALELFFHRMLIGPHSSPAPTPAPPLQQGKAQRCFSCALNFLVSESPEVLVRLKYLCA